MEPPSGSTGEERRRYPRFCLNLRVTLAVEGSTAAFPAELVDISEGGCFLRVPIPVRTGWHVFVSFALTAADSSCTAEGRIVRVQNVGFGVQFYSISEELREFIWAIHSTTPEDLKELLTGADPRIVVKDGAVAR